MKLAFIYFYLAMVATAVNIVTQYIFLELYKGYYSIQISVLCGTAVGLIIKYILDKRYIFNFTTHGLKHNTKTFALYSAMGVVTTAIFWAFELIFHLIFNESATLRYLGGTIGLAIGYLSKYQLDKKFVFKELQ